MGDGGEQENPIGIRRWWHFERYPEVGWLEPQLGSVETPPARHSFRRSPLSSPRFPASPILPSWSHPRRKLKTISICWIYADDFSETSTGYLLRDCSSYSCIHFYGVLRTAYFPFFYERNADCCVGDFFDYLVFLTVARVSCVNI